MKIFFVLSTILIIAMLMTGVFPRLLRVSFANNLLSASTTRRLSSTNVLSPVTSSIQTGALPTLAPFAEGIDTLELPEVLPSLTDFSALLKNGQSSLVGVYAANDFALPIIQQPQGRPDFVSTEDHMITEFSLPQRYGSTGLLAHNYLSGQVFNTLQPGQEVILVYGNGRMVTYRVTRIEKYQALTPNSPLSEFISLDTPDHKHLTSGLLFHRIYGQPGPLIFQTCIDEEGDPSWGRVFVIAEPVSEMQSSMPTIVPPSLN